MVRPAHPPFRKMACRFAFERWAGNARSRRPGVTQAACFRQRYAGWDCVRPSFPLGPGGRLTTAVQAQRDDSSCRRSKRQDEMQKV